MSTNIVDSDTADDDYIGHDTDRKHLLLKVTGGIGIAWR